MLPRPDRCAGHCGSGTNGYVKCSTATTQQQRCTSPLRVVASESGDTAFCCHPVSRCHSSAATQRQRCSAEGLRHWGHYINDVTCKLHASKCCRARVAHYARPERLYGPVHFHCILVSSGEVEWLVWWVSKTRRVFLLGRSAWERLRSGHLDLGANDASKHLFCINLLCLKITSF